MITRKKFERKLSNLVPKQYGIYATKDIKKDELIYDFSHSKTVSYVTQHNSEIADKKYIVYDDTDWSYHNHHCDPNMYHDFNILHAYALRSIKKGDEITRNYCTNHWKLGFPFECQCGANCCIGLVRGAKFLNFEQININVNYFAYHIREKLSKQTANILSKL
eukprot:499569_1